MTGQNPNQGLSTLNERIAEKIGKELIDLIPPEQWQQMVDIEISKFKRDIAPTIIQNEIQNIYKAQLSLKLTELTTSGEWNEITQEFDTNRLKTFIGECGGEIFGAVLAPAMSQVFQNLRNQLSVY